ncbi:hypothetical protein HPB49_025480 [Dermacentor silvarum]|uniref:Uncharacterized protein n=1 Tax=Dermacentor silvarum TaxID=543639 RepID=A0ACB8CTW9_DERSI|nr:hypothetical protein HPB49_025480 [Dermacentor silvarum]
MLATLSRNFNRDTKRQSQERRRRKNAPFAAVLAPLSSMRHFTRKHEQGPQRSMPCRFFAEVFAMAVDQVEAEWAAQATPELYLSIWEQDCTQEQTQPSLQCLLGTGKYIVDIYTHPAAAVAVATESYLARIDVLASGPCGILYEDCSFKFLLNCPPEGPAGTPRKVRLMTTNTGQGRLRTNLSGDGLSVLIKLHTSLTPSSNCATPSMPALFVAMLSLMTEDARYGIGGMGPASNVLSTWDRDSAQEQSQPLLRCQPGTVQDIAYIYPYPAKAPVIVATKDDLAWIQDLAL